MLKCRVTKILAYSVSLTLIDFRCLLLHLNQKHWKMEFLLCGLSGPCKKEEEVCSNDYLGVLWELDELLSCVKCWPVIVGLGCRNVGS